MRTYSPALTLARAVEPSCCSNGNTISDGVLATSNDDCVAGSLRGASLIPPRSWNAWPISEFHETRESEQGKRHDAGCDECNWRTTQCARHVRSADAMP